MTELVGQGAKSSVEKSVVALESSVTCKLVSVVLGLESELASNGLKRLEESGASKNGALLESAVELDAHAIGAMLAIKKIAEKQTPRERHDMRFPFPDKARPVPGTHQNCFQQRALIQTHHFAQLRNSGTHLRRRTYR